METVNTFNKKNTSQQGFALLMTIIVVSVVISIGLSVLDLTLKQVRLSTNAKDSEIAFHAANAGVECARYIRRIYATQMETGASIPLSGGLPYECFGVDASPNTKAKVNATSTVGDGDVFKYAYSFSWGTASDPRCTQVTTMVASATAMVNPTTLGRGVTTTNISTYISGYPTSAGIDWYCGPGERCTLLSVKGYNRACAASYGYGTVEREVLLQF